MNTTGRGKTSEEKEIKDMKADRFRVWYTESGFNEYKDFSNYTECKQFATARAKEGALLTVNDGTEDITTEFCKVVDIWEVIKR